jgi:transglycosylase-like protein with SLT domain
LPPSFTNTTPIRNLRRSPKLALAVAAATAGAAAVVGAVAIAGPASTAASTGAVQANSPAPVAPLAPGQTTALFGTRLAASRATGHGGISVTVGNIKAGTGDGGARPASVVSQAGSGHGTTRPSAPRPGGTGHGTTRPSAPRPGGTGHPGTRPSAPRHGGGVHGGGVHYRTVASHSGHGAASGSAHHRQQTGHAHRPGGHGRAGAHPGHRQHRGHRHHDPCRSSSLVHRWICHAELIMRRHGIPSSELDSRAAYIVVQHESGGNPHAYNGWDSNAAAGTPSEGITQVIGPTFNAYALPGYHNIWNPVDNMIAGFRYAISRYGSMDNIPGVVAVRSGQPYVGY